MKSKLLEYKGYYASINVSVEDECMFGKVEFINDSIVFGADTIPGLKATFEAEVDDYLEFCMEVGKAPDKTMTGSFNVRIGENLHKKAIMRSKSDGVTLNDVIKKSVEQYVNTSPEIHNHVSVNILKQDEHVIKTQTFDTSSNYTWKPSVEAPNEHH
jgi:predicted HicB family RNase H-like nuclease